MDHPGGDSSGYSIFYKANSEKEVVPCDVTETMRMRTRTHDPRPRLPVVAGRPCLLFGRKRCVALDFQDGDGGVHQTDRPLHLGDGGSAGRRLHTIMVRDHLAEVGIPTYLLCQHGGDGRVSTEPASTVQSSGQTTEPGRTRVLA